MKRACPLGGVPIALAGPCAGTAGLMRDGRLVQFGELCGVSADVRFAPDFVRFTPNSGRGKHPRRMSQFDPNQKSVVKGRRRPNWSLCDRFLLKPTGKLLTNAGVSLHPDRYHPISSQRGGTLSCQDGFYLGFSLLSLPHWR